MPRVVKKPQERKMEIIDAAHDLFQEKGYDTVTMQDVMNQLGIAKGTIYHYFRSKEELLEVVIEKISEKMIHKMRAAIEQVKGSALEKIEALVEAGRLEADSYVLDALHKKGNEAMHTRLLVATLMKQAPLYAELIEQGCQEGLFHTEAPLECAELMLSGIQFLTDLGIHPWTEETLQRRAQAFPKLVEQLLRAPKGAFGFLLNV
ncbi:TetR/AcrR family transcriptional regulator [Simkania sp.]|uniref:TetR/AcrR family transcriptional regulator n=1 Tax=Simkania sp. TaxID=34094 RepID=UPI003B5179EC